MEPYLIIVWLFFIGSAAQTAHVGTPVASEAQQYTATTLVAALEDPAVSSIVLVSNYSVGQAFHRYAGSPLPINRNLTVTGLHGVHDVLDMDYERSIINLCSTCILRLHDMTVANDRRGNGSPLDFVLGQPGSKVFMHNLNKLRRACVSGPATAPVVEHTQRSAIINTNATKQLFDIRNVTFYGHLYPDSLHLIDYTTDYPAIIQEGRGPSGGYAGSEVNVTRLCQHVVTEDCLQDKSADVCVNHLIDQLLAEENVSTTQGGVSGSKLAAAVAVPVVVAGVVLMALIALYIKRQHKRHFDVQHLIESGDTGPCTNKDLQAITNIPSAPAISSGLAGPLGVAKGWQVISSITTPLVGAGTDSAVQFGELLGTGSFGRVYKAVWAGREVAVKVIEHDISSAAAVDNEVQLMFLFNHPNIVRAYHCLTFGKISSSTACSAGVPNVNAAADYREAGTVDGSSDQSWGGPLYTALHQQQAATAPATISAATSVEVERSSSLQWSRDEHDSSDTARRVKSDVTPSAVTAGPAIAATLARKGAAALELQDSKGSLNVRGPSHEAPLADLSTIETGGRTGKAETWLIQEYCDGGTLGSIAGEWKALGECEQRMLSRLLLLQDCAQGLKVLHIKHVVHGDLNARNVLVSSSATSPTGLCAKLADLGLSRVIKQHQTHRTTNTVGTMSHMPPELLRYGRMSAAVDIYAFGVMMWEVFTGQPAFKKLHYGQFFETVVLRNLRPMIPAGMPADYQLLMEHCWATDPADRPSIDRVLECLRYMIQERQQCSPVIVAQPAATVVPAPEGPATPNPH